MLTEPLRALSLTTPWDHVVIHLGKTIENRLWPAKLRGQFLLHASMRRNRLEYQQVRDWVIRRFPRFSSADFPHFDQIQRGGIVGVATLVDCRWNDDPKAWVHLPGDAARWAMWDSSASCSRT